MSRKPRDYGIPGTTIFDGAQARKGYALDKIGMLVLENGA